MKREKILNEYLTIRISQNLIDVYRNFCEDNGFSISKRLRVFMENDIKGNIVIIKKNDSNNNVI